MYYLFQGVNHMVVMRARNCDLLGKKPNRKCRIVTFSHKRIKKVQVIGYYFSLIRCSLCNLCVLLL